ncbi:MAG: hypothetical protein Q4P36_01270, partial [Bowdeniella nasicola]|nr:hypothetical protein [Bowdeniella nasicola]
VEVDAAFLAVVFFLAAVEVDAAPVAAESCWLFLLRAAAPFVLAVFFAAGFFAVVLAFAPPVFGVLAFVAELVALEAFFAGAFVVARALPFDVVDSFFFGAVELVRAVLVFFFFAGVDFVREDDVEGTDTNRLSIGNKISSAVKTLLTIIHLSTSCHRCQALPAGT